MKRTRHIVFIIVLGLFVFMLAACTKSEFGMTENTEKKMTISAQNAAKDAFFMVGTLVVSDGEQIVILPDLKKGLIKVEIIQVSTEQSIDELPEMNGTPVITANVRDSDEISDTVSAGEYLIQATCLEKATGTIRIEVKPIS